jgi:hypothetical protein
MSDFLRRLIANGFADDDDDDNDGDGGDGDDDDDDDTGTKNATDEPSDFLKRLIANGFASDDDGDDGDDGNDDTSIKNANDDDPSNTVSVASISSPLQLQVQQGDTDSDVDDNDDDDDDDDNDDDNTSHGTSSRQRKKSRSHSVTTLTEDGRNKEPPSIFQLLAPDSSDDEEKEDEDEEDELEWDQDDDNANEVATSLMNAIYSQNTNASPLATPQQRITATAQAQATAQDDMTNFENPFFQDFMPKSVAEAQAQQANIKKSTNQPKVRPGEDAAVAMEIKKRKGERISEWKMLQQKWKKRRVQFHREKDVGNAVLNRARTVLRHKRQKELQNAEKLQQKQQEQQQQLLQQEEEEHEEQQKETVEDAIETDDIQQHDEGAEQEPLEEQDPRKELEQDGSQTDGEQVNNSQVSPRKPTEQHDHNDKAICSDDDEDDILLKRLPQSQVENELEEDVNYNARNRQLQLETLKKAKSPYAESLSGYWKQGKTAPKTKDLEFSFVRDFQAVCPEDTLSPPSSSKSRKRRRQQWQESPLLLAQLSQVELSPDHISLASPTVRTKPRLAIQGDHSSRARPLLLGRTYGNVESERPPHPGRFSEFPLDHAIYADKDFLHNRQLIRVAARFIVTNAGRMWQHQHEDRLLRALWKPRNRQKFQRYFLHLKQTEENANNWKTFLAHRWKDAKVKTMIARRLGILPSRGQGECLLSPPAVSGDNNTNVHQVRLNARRERKQLVKRFSDGETHRRDRPSRRRTLDAVRVPIIPPNVAYMHIPGAVPPVPACPLDATNCLFGPIDKHVSYRSAGAVDEATYKLTLSSLITRLAAAQASQQSLIEDDTQVEYDYECLYRHAKDTIEKLREQLFVFVDQGPAVARSDVYKLLNKFYPGVEIPVVQYYHSLMGFCSFVAAGISQPKTTLMSALKSDIKKYRGVDVNDTIEDLGDNEDPRVTPETLESLDDLEKLEMDDVARKIHAACHPHISHNGLRAFYRLHVTYALVTIAKILPTLAAERLARPLDNYKHRTPMDIFRRTFEYMDANDLIIEDHLATQWPPDDGESDGQVRVGELEFSVNRAVQILNACVRRNPLDPVVHEWRLAALCASLLLCSGHHFGGETLPFPSSWYKKRTASTAHNKNREQEQSMMKESTDAFGSMCARSTLDQFENVRRSSKEALKLLLNLAAHQGPSSRAHLAISSFWEWKQVVALVAGRSSLNTQYLEDIRHSHFFHSALWALQDRSELALTFLEAVSGPQGESSDIQLKRLAATIEDDPNDIGHWRALANAIGPLGYRYPDSNSLSSACDRRECKECHWLREGFAFDHAALGSRKTSGEWWGAEIISWWYPHYLMTNVRVPEEFRKQSKLSKLQDYIKVGMLDWEEGSASLNRPSRSWSIVKPPDISWMWSADDKAESTGHDTPQPVDGSDGRIHQALPKFFSGIVRANNRTGLKPPWKMMDFKVEAIFLKLVITCHLYGVDHGGNIETIVELLRRSVDRNDVDCTEWQCVLELHRLGVDVSKVIRHFQNIVRLEYEEREEAKAKSKRPKFTEREREALIAGLELFGNGKWEAISKRFRVFDGRHRADIYVSRESMFAARDICW